MSYQSMCADVKFCYIDLTFNYIKLKEQLSVK